MMIMMMMMMMMMLMAFDDDDDDDDDDDGDDDDRDDSSESSLATLRIHFRTRNYMVVKDTTRLLHVLRGNCSSCDLDKLRCGRRVLCSITWLVRIKVDANNLACAVAGLATYACPVASVDSSSRAACFRKSNVKIALEGRAG